MKIDFYNNNQQLKEKMIRKFVHNIPHRLDLACATNASYETKELANAMDYFEFHYRHYVSGIHLTLHRVLAETRNLKNNKHFSKELILEIIQEIENDILETELYELMPRHIKASQRVLKQAEIIPSKMNSLTKTI